MVIINFAMISFEMNSNGIHWFYSCRVIMGYTNQRLNQTCGHAHREFRTEKRAIPIYGVGGFWREGKFVDPSSPGQTGNKSDVGLLFIEVSESSIPGLCGPLAVVFYSPVSLCSYTV